MIRKTAAGLTAAALLATPALADAAPTVHRITLPGIHAVQTGCAGTARTVIPALAVAHVTFTTSAPAASLIPGLVRYTVTAHTVSPAYRWTRAAVGEGWTRVTRRLATATFDVQSLPACAP